MGSSKHNNREWTKETTDLLNRVRLNSVALSEYHRRRFYYYKGFSKYFDLPILVLSIFGSSFSVGMQAYLNQKMISGVSCLIGVVVSIITSIKLYLNVDTSMQSELKMSKEFYSLSIDIFRMLTLTCGERGQDGGAYLQKVYGVYMKLMEGSHLLTRRFKGDQLTPTEEGVADDLYSLTSTPTHGSDSPPRYSKGLEDPAIQHRFTVRQLFGIRQNTDIEAHLDDYNADDNIIEATTPPLLHTRSNDEGEKKSRETQTQEEEEEQESTLITNTKAEDIIVL